MKWNGWKTNKENLEEEQGSGWEEDDYEDNVCRHPEHDPPKHMVVPPGKVYRHVCPACGATVRIKVSQITLEAR